MVVAVVAMVAGPLDFGSKGCSDKSIIQVINSFIIEAVPYKLMVTIVDDIDYQDPLAVEALPDTGMVCQQGIRTVAAELGFTGKGC